MLLSSDPRDSEDEAVLFSSELGDLEDEAVLLSSELWGSEDEAVLLSSELWCSEDEAMVSSSELGDSEDEAMVSSSELGDSEDEAMVLSSELGDLEDEAMGSSVLDLDPRRPSAVARPRKTRDWATPRARPGNSGLESSEPAGVRHRCRGRRLGNGGTGRPRDGDLRFLRYV